MSQDRRLGLVLAINMAMVAGLLAVGLLAHSLGVLASGADYLGDALGTALGLAALRLSRREHGRPRATTLAALANSSLLLIVTLAVAFEAIRRLITGAPSIDAVPVIIISLIAAAAMIACAFILGEVGGEISMESVMLDTLADAAAAIGVAISATVILATNGTYWFDPLIALLIAIVIAYHALRLMRRARTDLRDKHRSASATARNP